MKELEWIVPGKRPRGRVLHVVRRAAGGEDRYPEVANGSLFALGQQHRLERLPYLEAQEGNLPVAALAMGLMDEDLLLLGFGTLRGLAEADAAAALIAEAVAVARETARRRLVAPVTNADVLALLHLQSGGFALEAAHPWQGPEHQGVARIAATHELLFVRPIG